MRKSISKRSTSTSPAENAGSFDLGAMMGRQEAFGLVAGRCSAAQAEALRRIRDEKLYLTKAANWREFAETYLGMGKSNANRIIRLLEEFGASYFELTQFTRIAPQDYRAIAPSVRDHALHVNGEAIALIPENARKIQAAVRDLRKTTENKPEDSAVAVADLERRIAALVAGFRAAAQSEDRYALASILAMLRSKLDVLELELAA